MGVKLSCHCICESLLIRFCPFYEKCKYGDWKRRTWNVIETKETRNSEGKLIMLNIVYKKDHWEKSIFDWTYKIKKDQKDKINDEIYKLSGGNGMDNIGGDACIKLLRELLDDS